MSDAETEERMGFVRKWIQDFGLKDLGDVIVYSTLAYAGYRVVPADAPLDVKLMSLGVGPLFYNLIQAPSNPDNITLGFGLLEIPVNAQIVGLIGLAALGLINLPWEAMNKSIEDARKTYDDAQALVRQCEEFRDLFLIPRGADQADITQLNALIVKVKRTTAYPLHISEAASPAYQADVRALGEFYNSLVDKYSSGGGAR